MMGDLANKELSQQLCRYSPLDLVFMEGESEEATLALMTSESRSESRVLRFQIHTEMKRPAQLITMFRMIQITILEIYGRKRNII